MNQSFYKVLWIEDDDSIVESTNLVAEKFELDLDRFSNLDDALEKLNTNFEDYSAIILDANCIINRNRLADKNFIGYALSKLPSLFDKKGTPIPWYIYSAGVMENFESVMELAEKIRDDFKSEWGELYYLKDAPPENPKNVQALFGQIRKVAQRRFQNSVLFKHQDVFSFLGKDKLINFPEAREYMINMLSTLYFPERNFKFQYEANPLRKVLEYLFRSSKEKGLLPEECFDERIGSINLSNASKFMTGQIIECKNHGYWMRWGKEEEDHIFDTDIAMYVKNILKYSNKNSHTHEGRKCEESEELFFSYVLLLCHVIRWFGKYVEKHPHIEENRKMHTKLNLEQYAERIWRKRC